MILLNVFKNSVPYDREKSDTIYYEMKRVLHDGKQSYKCLSGNKNQYGV